MSTPDLSVMNFVTPIATVLETVRSRVASVLTGYVATEVYRGSSMEDIVRYLKHMRMGMRALVWCAGSEYANLPRRETECHITLCHEATRTQGDLFTDSETVIKELDHACLVDSATCIVSSDAALDLDPDLTVVDIELTIKDN